MWSTSCPPRRHSTLCGPGLVERERALAPAAGPQLRHYAVEAELVRLL
ncbi:hypothetical protein [Streptomyces sp900116325]